MSTPRVGNVNLKWSGKVRKVQAERGGWYVPRRGGDGRESVPKVAGSAFCSEEASPAKARLGSTWAQQQKQSSSCGTSFSGRCSPSLSWERGLKSFVELLASASSEARTRFEAGSFPISPVQKYCGMNRSAPAWRRKKRDTKRTSRQCFFNLTAFFRPVLIRNLPAMDGNLEL